MNKLVLLITGLLGAGATVNYEHLDFRPEISTDMAKIVMNGSEVPVNPDNPDDECPCNKKTGIITHGDGHTSKCPCDNGECGCVNKTSALPELEPESEPEPEASVKPITPNTNTQSRSRLLRWRKR